MWKVVILLLSISLQSKSDHVANSMIDRVFQSLESNLNYITLYYDKINLDCLFGVVLGGAVLDDSLSQPGPYQNKLIKLKEKINDIYFKALSVVKQHPSWETFAKYIVVLDLWQKPIKYKLAQFRTAYPKQSRVQAVFDNDLIYINGMENLSDMCLLTIINSTLELKPQANCTLPPLCRNFLGKLDSSSGYVTTHKLLLLQLAKTRKCKMHPKSLAGATKELCSAIYEEAISIDYYVDIGDVFDLLLEQILLCGLEGYADFLKRDWLEKILRIQYKTGCFPPLVASRKKRNTNVWKDGCADHTTGLGTGVLSLYLNYLLKNVETLSLIPGWY